MSRERRNQFSRGLGLASSERVAERARWLDHWVVILKGELERVVPNTGYEALAVPGVLMEKMSIRIPGMLGTEMDTDGIHKAVVINTEYLSLPDRVVAEILMHQLVHHWQQSEGRKPSKLTNHNKQFVEVSEELGMYVRATSGNHYRYPSGRLVNLMYQHNLEPIVPPAVPEDVGINDWWNYLPGQEDGINRRGVSALVKWTCGCQDIRVGKGNFYATCSICHNAFHRSDIIQDISPKENPAC